MKKIILFLIIFFVPCYLYAEETDVYGFNQPEITIEKGYKPEIKNSEVSVENNIFQIKPVQQQPLPKTIREHKIDYDYNGRADSMPYALKDILIEY